MNALCALTTGFGIGLASLGGLWLTIHHAIRSPRGGAVLALSQVLRLALAAAGFYAVSREGPEFLLPGLAGYWIARRISVRRWGALPEVPRNAPSVGWAVPTTTRFTSAGADHPPVCGQSPHEEGTSHAGH